MVKIPLDTWVLRQQWSPDSQGDFLAGWSHTDATHEAVQLVPQLCDELDQLREEVAKLQVEADYFRDKYDLLAEFENS